MMPGELLLIFSVASVFMFLVRVGQIIARFLDSN
jgi:hypothetical protein